MVSLCRCMHIPYVKLKPWVPTMLSVVAKDEASQLQLVNVVPHRDLEDCYVRLTIEMSDANEPLFTLPLPWLRGLDFSLHWELALLHLSTRAAPCPAAVSTFLAKFCPIAVSVLWRGLAWETRRWPAEEEDNDDHNDDNGDNADVPGGLDEFDIEAELAELIGPVEEEGSSSSSSDSSSSTSRLIKRTPASSASTTSNETAERDGRE